MSRQRPLRGACSCGRNVYSVVVPTTATEEAHVFFDDSSHFSTRQTSPVDEAELIDLQDEHKPRL